MKNRLNTLTLEDYDTKQSYEVSKNKDGIITIREISNGEISSISIDEHLVFELVTLMQKVEIETDYDINRRKTVNPLSYSFMDEINSLLNK